MIPHFVVRRAFAPLLAVAVAVLPSCTNLKNDSDRTRAEGTLAGATVGAAAGAGAGALLKKKPAAAAEGAAVGAVVGGAAGAAYGNAVARKKEAYTARESGLDSQIAGLRRQVSVVREHNDSLRSLVAAKRQQLSAILASDRSAGPTVQEFDLRTSILSKMGEIDHEAMSWQETIDAHKAVLKKASDDPHSAELQSAIDDLSAQRAELLRQRAALAGINDKLKK